MPSESWGMFKANGRDGCGDIFENIAERIHLSRRQASIGHIPEGIDIVAMRSIKVLCPAGRRFDRFRKPTQVWHADLLTFDATHAGVFRVNPRSHGHLRCGR
jgi:hypothetical protein